MKIAIESSVLAVEKKTGIDIYAQTLLGRTIASMPQDQFWLCYLKFFGRPAAHLGIKGKNVHIRRNAWLPGKLYNSFERYFIALPYDLIMRLRADIYIFPNFIRWPLALTKKSIVFVYDLGFIDAPETIIDRHRRYLSRFVPRSLQAASHVVTISEYSKKRIMEVYGLSGSAVSVIPPGVDHEVFKPTVEPAVLKKYGITKPYILFLGTVEPRKNLVRLLQAYALLPESLRKQYQLVVAGGKGWLDGEIGRLIGELGSQVVQTGYIDEVDKPALYSQAKLFVFPSLYEGWGMPVVEAMACGTPVITASNSSLPEAGGEAALFIDAHDSTALAHAIERVVTDDKLAQAMVQRGLKHVQTMKWEQGAKQLKQIIDSVARS